MKSHQILKDMHFEMNQAVKRFEAGDQTLGDRVVQNEECLAAVIGSVTALVTLVCDLENQSATQAT